MQTRTAVFVFYALIVLIGILLIIAGHTMNRKRKREIKVAVKQGVRKKTEKERSRFDKFLDRRWMVTDSEKSMEQAVLASGLPITPRTVTKQRLGAVAGAVLFSALLKNTYIVVPLAIMLWQIPFGLVKRRALKRETVFGEQLLDNFQMFVTDFASTNSVQTSVFNMTKKSVEPLRTEWELLSRNLSSGRPPKECFVTFADRTASKWSRIFAQIMISYYKTGTPFTEQLMSLTGKMSDEKITLQENQTEISSMVTLNVILNAIVPVVYIVNRIAQPDAAGTFTNTTSGRLIIFAVTMACMLSLWLGKKIAEW